jgi:hypothetical protein
MKVAELQKTRVRSFTTDGAILWCCYYVESLGTWLSEFAMFVEEGTPYTLKGPNGVNYPVKFLNPVNQGVAQRVKFILTDPQE